MVRIPLRARNGDIRAFVLVDDDDLHLVSQWNWSLSKDGYAVAGQPQVRMHRVLCGLERGDPRQPDHINRNKLDNRRANLRVVDAQVNQQNKPASGRSGYRGVSWVSKYGKWRAQAMLNGKGYYFGLYDDPAEAARAASAWRAEHMAGAVEARAT